MEIAKVVEGYESRSGDGLKLVKGEEVEILDRSDSYWWKGKVDGKIGLFPSSRVVLPNSDVRKEAPREILSKSDSVVKLTSPRSVGKSSSGILKADDDTKKKNAGEKKTVIALFSFAGKGEDELSFQVQFYFLMHLKVFFLFFVFLFFCFQPFNF
jgi:hypothetical protein